MVVRAVVAARPCVGEGVPNVLRRAILGLARTHLGRGRARARGRGRGRGRGRE